MFWLIVLYAACVVGMAEAFVGCLAASKLDPSPVDSLILEYAVHGTAFSCALPSVIWLSCLDIGAAMLV